jgi:hypothetical protein
MQQRPSRIGYPEAALPKRAAMQQRPSRSCGCPSFCFISCFVGVQKHQLMFSPKWDNLLLGVVGPSVPSRSGHEAAALPQRPSRSGPSAASLPQRSSAAALPQRLSRRGPPTSALKQRPSHSGPPAVLSPILGILLLGFVGPSPPAAALPQRPSRSGPRTLRCCSFACTRKTVCRVSCVVCTGTRYQS